MRFKKPSIPAPKVSVPRVSAPKISVPKLSAPKLNASKLRAPSVRTPSIGKPKVGIPKIAVPKTKVPKVGTPKISAPKLKAPKVTSSTFKSTPNNVGKATLKPPTIRGPKLPPGVKLPKSPQELGKQLGKLDPRQKLEEARTRAMKSLKKLSPAEIKKNIERSFQQKLAQAQAKTGTRYNSATGELDLRGTKAGRMFSSWLSKFAQGNSRESSLQVFSYNVKKDLLHLSMMVRHRQRQNWGSLGMVELYSCTQTAEVEVEFSKPSLKFEIDLGPLGPKINMRAVEAMLKGDLVAMAEAAAPDMSRVITYERKNDYKDVLAKYEAKHGGGRVYLASKEFVEWAGSKSIGKYAATGVVSGGAAVIPQIMKDAAEMAEKEIPKIVDWLKKLGIKEGVSMAKELLTGRRPRWPYIKFEMVVIPHYAREVNPQTGLKTGWRRFNNLGFVIVVEPKMA
jgi:hypothetical protein